MISKAFLALAIIATVLLLSTSADITLQTQLPAQAEGSITVQFRGTLTMLSDFADAEAGSTIQFDNVADPQPDDDIHPPVLQNAHISLFAYNKDIKPVSNLFILSTQMNAGTPEDIQAALNAAQYHYKKDELIHFTGYLQFAPTTDHIDAEHLSTYKALMSYKTKTGGTSSQSLTATSSHKAPAGLWVDTVRVDPQASFYTHKASAKRDFFSVLLKNLPFSTQKVSFFAAGHLILTKQSEDVLCSLNGVDGVVTIDKANQRFAVEINQGPDFAVLYETDFNLQCEHLLFTSLQIGDNTNSIYLEMIDHLYNEPAAITIPIRHHSLPTHYPIIDPEIITGTLPSPNAHSALVCSYDVSVEDPALTFQGLHDAIFQVTLQNFPVTPTEVFSVLSASFSTEQHYDTRVPIYKAQLKADSDASPKTFTTSIAFNETAWALPKVNKAHPLLLTYTFVFPKGQTPVPLTPIMPQCALTFTEKESQISIYQIMMNTVGQPISPQSIEFSPSSRASHGKQTVDFSLGKINGGFNHFVLDLPQEDAYFTGDFKCKLTQHTYPDGDDKQKPVTTTFDLNRVDNHGKPYNPPSASTEVIFHHETLFGGSEYAIKCPNSFITPFLEPSQRFSQVSYNATLMYVYAYTNDQSDIYTPRFYLAGSNYIQLTGDDKKSHKLIWAAIFCVLALGLGLAILGVYVRAKKAKADSDREDGFFQQLQDQDATGTDYH